MTVYLPLQEIISKSPRSLLAVGLKCIFSKNIFHKKCLNPLCINGFGDFLNCLIFATDLPSLVDHYLKIASIPCRSRAGRHFFKKYFSLKMLESFVALGFWRFSKPFLFYNAVYLPLQGIISKVAQSLVAVGLKLFF